MNTLLNLSYFPVLVALVIIAVIVWILSKRRRKPIPRYVFWAGILLSPVCFLGVLFLTMFYVHTYDFSSEAWKEDRKERWRMAEDIVKSQCLIGKIQHKSKHC